MPTTNRISDFIFEGSPDQSPVAPSGRQPNHLRIAADGREPEVPRDLFVKLIAPPPDAPFVTNDLLPFAPS